MLSLISSSVLAFISLSQTIGEKSRSRTLESEEAKRSSLPCDCNLIGCYLIKQSHGNNDRKIKRHAQRSLFTPTKRSVKNRGVGRLNLEKRSVRLCRVIVTSSGAI
ncbi:hypothetical protein [Paenibacillus segetis]|uniref:hypothetical protein n=1 Tax=Paenibacillus segetis TaxID=1325360 RepID=UPI0016687989|nr:hypothetical protein [Paenibacillus segetis]